MTNVQKRAQRLKEARQKGTHTKAEWQAMKDFFKVCVMCYGKHGYTNLERDHIKPLYQGGSDSIRNIQPLCAKCNAGKGADDTDYRALFCEANLIEFPEVWI